MQECRFECFWQRVQLLNFWIRLFGPGGFRAATVQVLSGPGCSGPAWSPMRGLRDVPPSSYLPLHPSIRPHSLTLMLVGVWPCLSVIFLNNDEQN